VGAGIDLRQRKVKRAKRKGRLKEQKLNAGCFTCPSLRERGISNLDFYN
jgi:hypothetical protein